jgi:hypothetical protein
MHISRFSTRLSSWTCLLRDPRFESCYHRSYSTFDVGFPPALQAKIRMVQYSLQFTECYNSLIQFDDSTLNKSVRIFQCAYIIQLHVNQHPTHYRQLQYSPSDYCNRKTSSLATIADFIHRCLSCNSARIAQLI